MTGKMRNKLRRDQQSIKNRKKLYKSGKLWLTMGLTTVVGTAVVTTHANASTIPSTRDSAVNVVDAVTTAPSDEVTLKTSVSSDPTQIVSQSEDTANDTDGTDLVNSAGRDGEIESSVASTAKAQVTALVADASATQMNDAKTAATEKYQQTGTPQVITAIAPAAEIATGIDGTANWDIDQDGNLQIHAGTLSDQNTWQDHSADIKSIQTEAGVVASDKSNNDNYNIHLFGDLPNVKTIDLTGLDTSQMTNMSHLFVNDPNLESIIFDPTKFNTSKVTDFSMMFNGDTKLTTLDLSHFDTSNGTIFYGMFEGASALTEIDVSHFDTSKATNMQNMFVDTNALRHIDVSNFDTSHVTNMNSMFERAGRDAPVNPEDPLVLDVSNWNVDNVTDFWGMFDQSTVQKLDLSKWNMKRATNTSHFLNMMPYLWDLKLGPNVKLTDGLLDEVPKTGTQLPDGSLDAFKKNNITVNTLGLQPTSTGWQAVASGDEYNPEGSAYLASTLTTMYPGDGTGGTEEYVWSQAVTNYLHFIDVNSGQIIPGGKFYDYVYTYPYGTTTLNTKPDSLVLPKGYHFATASELKSGQVQLPASSTEGKEGTVFKMYVAPTLPSLDESKQQVTLTTNFVDQEGNVLQKADIRIGTQGTKLEIAAPDIKGYKLVDTSLANIPVILKGNVMTLTLTYEPNTGQVPDENELPAILTVKYVDENGNPLQVMTTQTGKQGTHLEIVAPEIPGYALVDDSQVKTPVTLQGSALALTLTYKPEGTNGTPGAAINTSSTPTPIPSETPTSETSPGNPVETTVVPEGDTTPSTPEQGQRVQPNKAASESEEPGEVEPQSQVGKGSTVAPAKSGIVVTSVQKNQKQTLPQTDEPDSQGILSLMGIGLLGVLGLGMKKRKED
ncbi:BspA family leucine-rich repeat surface protein [Secundilactobacillus mixtipabuli]|uniref:Putative membrane protein n=1 Tax=Secundilactobacillus mixtipabuli TaxID=1435342 RepID=A0A1Z5I9R1_9LACO|nr:BspA family leucine-rich repeat surface protein [Secundilactobacillus mixtipabuli]GAW98464.1 putative membrane protein [Secundilactobacillus mixtipabuli]